MFLQAPCSDRVRTPCFCRHHVLTGFYLLARRPDLAKRIRLSLRPRRTPSDDASAGSAPAGEPSTGSPDAEPDADGGEPTSAQ